MIVQLQGGPKSGESVVVSTGTSHWSFAEQIPGREAKASFEEDPSPIGPKTWRAGVYAFSGQRIKTIYGGTRPVFFWQGWSA